MSPRTCPTMVVGLVLLVLAISYREVQGHVALTFPRARKYDLDFLDNARTPGPCGMPRGDVKTSLLSGSNFNVTWHLAYPHRGGFRLQILDALDRPLVDLTPVTKSSEFVEDDATAQNYAVQLPQNFTCTDCTIRLLREAEEWGASYRFWSCADIDIVDKTSYREDCSGHGRYLLGRCRCDRLYHGTRCEFKEECLDDSDCGIQGTCIDNGGTTAPTKHCYCNTGWFGPGCAKRSPIKTIDVGLDSYTMKKFSDSFTFYWRILKESKELEGVMVVNSTSWVGVGWRPSDLTPACRAFPDIQEKPKGEPLPQPEPKAEPEPESEPKAEPRPESEPVPEPESGMQRSGTKRRSAKAHDLASLASTPRSDVDVTVQTSVTYRVSTKQGRRKRSPESVAPSKDGEPVAEPSTVDSTDTTPEPISEPKSEPEPASKATPRSHSEPIPTAATSFHSESISKAEPRSQTEPISKPEPVSAPETEPSSELEPKSEPEPSSESEPKSEPEPSSESEPKSEPKSEREPSSESEPKSEPKSEREPSSESEPKSEPKSEREPSSEAEPKSEPEPSLESESKSEPEPSSESEPKSEPKSEREPSSEAEPKSEPEPTSEQQPKSETTSEPEPISGPKSSATKAILPGPGHKFTPKHDFSPMDCTDIIIGSARGNSHRIGDYYTRDRSTPRKDEYWGGRDTLTAAMGFERDGVTTILFRRKLAANEPTDHEIVNGDMQVIWAKGQEPGKYVHNPPSGIEKAKVSVKDFYKPDELKYHGHGSQRGAVTMNFFVGKKTQEMSSNGNTAMQNGSCSGEWRYPRQCSPENGTCEYSIQWKYKGRKDELSFVISTTNTNTWTGVGFSDDEKMSQTDAVLGWVDDKSGRAFVMDTWISGYNAPLLDPSQDIYNTGGSKVDGVTTLKFSRKRITKDNRDLSFTDDHCLYMMYPVKGGIFNAVSKKIRKHDAVPVVSSERICIKSCGLEELDELTTPAPPRLYYDVEVKLVNLGDGFIAPTPGSPDFEVISNRISDSFGPVFEKLPGYYQIRLNKLQKDVEQNGVIARMNLILDKNEGKGRSLKPLDTSAAAEKALKEALVNGKVGALSVDPQYLVVRAPRVNDLGGGDTDEESSFTSDLFLDATKLYIVVGCVAALLALALLQASCTLYRSSRRRATKDRLIASNAWKDYASGANTNFAFEAFETEEKAPPPPVSSLPRHREMTSNGLTGTDTVEGPNRPMGPRATYSLPRAPGTRHTAPIQPGYYTQDRRDHYQRSKNNAHNPSSGVSTQPNQPDFYFMPSQRKYSGEVVRVYVDYGSQPQK